MMTRIVKAKALPDRTLLLFFESGQVKLLDMKPYIEKGGVWAEIRDPAVFSRVSVQQDMGGLEWPGDIDFCPDTAFKAAKPLPTALLRDLIITYRPKERPETRSEEIA